MTLPIPLIYGADETVFSVSQKLAKLGLRISTLWTGRFEAVEANQPEPLTHEQKAEARKHEMGESYVCHPNYSTNPRHIGDPSLNALSRKAFLQTIAENAQRDREKNPAYIRSLGA